MSRAGMKPLQWAMSNGNTQWVYGDTLENIDKIYDYLVTIKRWVTKATISKETGVSRSSVRNAINLMAFKTEPLVRIKTNNYKEKHVEEIKLIKKVE